MTTTPTHIRTLFLHPSPTYAIGEAATLLEMDWRDLRGWMESGEVEGIETDEGLILPWAELVSFGMDFWSQEVVEEALGAELAEALPELLRLAELEVRIPRMEVVALERLAALDGERPRAGVARPRVRAFGGAVAGSARIRGGAGLAGDPTRHLAPRRRSGGCAGCEAGRVGRRDAWPTPRRSDDAGRKTEAAMFSVAARRAPAPDVDAVIH